MYWLFITLVSFKIFCTGIMLQYHKKGYLQKATKQTIDEKKSAKIHAGQNSFAYQ